MNFDRTYIESILAISKRVKLTEPFFDGSLVNLFDIMFSLSNLQKG